MMNLTGQKQYQKPEKLTPAEKKEGKDRMAAIAKGPCIVCYVERSEQLSRTTVHHLIHGRYGTLKNEDRKTIGLCDGHHQGNFDTSKIALHREPDRWKQRYGEDHEWMAVQNDLLAGELN